MNRYIAVYQHKNGEALVTETGDSEVKMIKTLFNCPPARFEHMIDRDQCVGSRSSDDYTCFLYLVDSPELKHILNFKDIRPWDNVDSKLIKWRMENGTKGIYEEIRKFVAGVDKDLAVFIDWRPLDNYEGHLVYVCHANNADGSMSFMSEDTINALMKFESDRSSRRNGPFH